MLLTTTSEIPGKEFEVLGMVIGNFVNSKNMFSDIGQSLKTIVGGELKAYTEMMSQARDEATKRMIAEAEKLGADAVVCVRFASSEILAGSAELMSYGTAVKYKDN